MAFSSKQSIKLTSSPQISLKGQISDATTGQPQAIASGIVNQNPSKVDKEI